MKSLVIIQAKTQEDLEECLTIRRAVFQIEKQVPAEIEIDEHDSLNNDYHHFLVIYDNKKVGALRCKLRKEGIRLQRFCFLKEYRNLGLGKETVKYIEAFYKQSGTKKIEMDAKYEVYPFYEKCGYICVSEPFIEAGIKHIAMEKTI